MLTKKIREEGMGKAKIQVLEALLRLRQAACHPGLIDKSKTNIPSAKLETLLEQLDEVLFEGHKVLIFSQFTSLLTLVKKELDRRGVVYEYLDGKSTRRKEKVELRFQTDALCPVFLISLKAGGHGLNLTAADYVFILDPWWNPAVKRKRLTAPTGWVKQAGVRLSLIARDTVEEKIFELQGQKRSLAEAVITADETCFALDRRRPATATELSISLANHEQRLGPRLAGWRAWRQLSIQPGAAGSRTRFRRRRRFPGPRPERHTPSLSWRL